MRLQSQRELDATREKLRLTEQQYEKSANSPCENEHVQELTLQSLKRIINQMKEEIAVFESHVSPLPIGCGRATDNPQRHVHNG